jgi:hypothetical protein
VREGQCNGNYENCQVFSYYETHNNSVMEVGGYSMARTAAQTVMWLTVIFADSVNLMRRDRESGDLSIVAEERKI